MGLTFDTGALIGLERSRHLMRKVFETAFANRVVMIVPAAVIAEWWRAGVHETSRALLLRAMRVEPLTDHVARLAGVVLTRVPKATTIDAIVMASASQRPGDVVYTSDVDDLERIRVAVPACATLRIHRV